MKIKKKGNTKVDKVPEIKTELDEKNVKFSDEPKSLSKNLILPSIVVLLAAIFVLLFFFVFENENKFKKDSETTNPDTALNELKQKELNLKEKELKLKEKELNLRIDDRKFSSLNNILLDWINSIENEHELSRFYDSEVKYYTGGIIPLSKVIADKNKFYDKWENREFRVEDVSVSEMSGEKYKIVYDKYFDCENSVNHIFYNGKVRSVLVFKNVGDQFLITEEYDETVYYTNKSK